MCALTTRSKRISTSDPVAHRRFLSDGVDVRPFHGTDVFDKVGGQPTVDRLIEGLYARIADDAELRPIFPSDLSAERERQKLFFGEWLGGPRRYNAVAYWSLKHKHDAVPITRALAGRWLAHFRNSLEGVVGNASLREKVLERVQGFAFALVNQAETPRDPEQRRGARRYMQERSKRAATCALGSPEHPRNRASDFARRGDVAGLAKLCKAHPETLARATFAALIVHNAVVAGKLEAVRWLLDHGVSANLPAPYPPSSEIVMFVTPLCAARIKRRASVEKLLLERGAKNDVFTAAMLGELDELRAMLDAVPALSQVIDPAGDILEVTPVHHAIYGGQLDALRALLDHADGPVIGSTRALNAAAAQQTVKMVELLVAHGADASEIGAGAWVLHEEIAPILARAGARVDPSGDWIAVCTGNRGRKDNPEWVRALLRHGARVDDRRRRGVMATGATALHYAAKAGFLKTIEVLLEHGADPNALDDKGESPLDWLSRASKSVDRARVRKLLTRAK